MTTVVNANPYKPSKLKIHSVGIGIEDDTNDNLLLTQTQAVIAAERRYVAANGVDMRTFGLIVDKEGVGINMSLADRASAKNSYALYVDGSVFVTGTITANNIIGPQSGGGSGGEPNFWVMGDRETHNIYYTGGVTLGNNASTRFNQHTLNIVQSADRNIEHAQISVQNTAAAQMRVGIVGTSNISPAVFNTRPGVPIEFHIGREKSYFDSVYKQWYYESGSLCNIISEVPYYDSADVAPHFTIDVRGNVGIRTSVTPRFDFEIRRPDTIEPRQIVIENVSEYMNLSVHGNVFTSNLMIWDYETSSPKNIDSMYIRKVGVTLKANQIVPGEFGFGKYIFPTGIDVDGQVNIDGSSRITGNLTVDNDTNINHLYAYDAVIFDVASFRNDIYVNRDMIVEESLRLKGGMFTEVPLANGNLAWCNVQFTIADTGFSNINYYGAGFTTPGRVGVGIVPGADEVNNQFVIKKRGDTERLYEMELSSPSGRLIKSAYIGHPVVDRNRATDVFQDASLVFATPASQDPDYNLFGYAQALQNFYFYPGSYNTMMSASIVSQSNAPVLNVHTSKRVGINTYDPSVELDVVGSIRFSGDLRNGADKVGIWTERELPHPGGGTFLGLEYFYPTKCSNVAINAVPETDIGLVVGGGIKSRNGYFTSLGEKISPWINSETSQYSFAGSQPLKMFTLAKAGIGIKQPSATLEIKDPYSSNTTMRLWRPDNVGDEDPVSSIQFDGFYKPWIIQHNDALQTLEFGYGSNVFNSNINRRAMWMIERPSGRQQVIIGGNLLTNPNPNASLVVDGNMSVIGDVSITGRYIINGQALVNSNVNVEFGLQPTLGNDDVYISGRRIFINPKDNVTGMLAVGYTEDRVTLEENETAIFRVYQDNPAVSVIAKFICRGETGLIEIRNTSGQVVRMGFVKDRSGFGILDQNNNPYFGFSNVGNGERMVVINGVGGNPTANLHVQTKGLGENMFKLTRYYTGTNTGRSAPEMEFENRFENDSGIRMFQKWTVRGPDTSYAEKLSMLFAKNNEPSQELFCFTSNGCMGIGNTEPKFALDVTAAGDRGVLRLYNPTHNGAPQIILQAGVSEYGYDMVNDYRINAMSNTFTIDSVNTSEYRKLLYFDKEYHLGILGESASNFDVNVNGSLNVTKTIYIDGNPLFDTSSSGSGEGFKLTGTNIFITPKMNFNGGVYINRTIPTSNLFHITAGYNANLAVFDSSTSNECQVHFRGLAAADTTRYNIYRMSQSNTSFQLEHYPESGSDPHIESDHVGYSNVVRWGPSSKVTGDYDVEMWGSVVMRSASPSINLATSVIGHSNDCLYMLPTSNLGIGTTVTNEAKVHIVGGAAGKPTIRVDQKQSAAVASDIARFYNSIGAQVFTVTNRDVASVGIGTGAVTPMNGTSLHVDGRFVCTSDSSNANLFVNGTTGVGIGTTAPMYKLDVIGNTRVRDILYVQTNANNQVGSNCVVCLWKSDSAPTSGVTNYMGFGLGTNTLRYHVDSAVANHVFYADSNELVRINGVGNVGIGTYSPIEKLHVHGNVVVTGAVYPLTNTLQNLGGAYNRWRDLYLANSINLAGTTFTVNNTGNLQVESGGAPTTVIANSYIMSDPQMGSNLEMRWGVNDPVVYLETDMNGTVTNQYIPFLRSATTGGISVGTTTPEGVLHIVGHSAIPSIIVDHDNASASSVFDVRDNGATFATFAKGGNVGFGTTQPGAKVDVSGTFKVTGSSAVFNTTTLIASGNVGIGTTAPVDKFHVVGSQTFDGTSRFKENVYMEKDIDVRGNSYVHGDQTTDSDMRLKSDIRQISGALDKVRALAGYTFVKEGRMGTGVIAQEVEKVLPEAVVENPDTGYLSVAYGNMMGLIIEAIKELDIKLDRTMKALEDR